MGEIKTDKNSQELDENIQELLIYLDVIIKDKDPTLKSPDAEPAAPDRSTGEAPGTPAEPAEPAAQVSTEAPGLGLSSYKDDYNDAGSIITEITNLFKMEKGLDNIIGKLGETSQTQYQGVINDYYRLITVCSKEASFGFYRKNKRLEQDDPNGERVPALLANTHSKFSTYIHAHMHARTHAFCCNVSRE